MACLAQAEALAKIVAGVAAEKYFWGLSWFGLICCVEHQSATGGYMG